MNEWLEPQSVTEAKELLLTDEERIERLIILSNYDAKLSAKRIMGIILELAKVSAYIANERAMALREVGEELWKRWNFDENRTTSINELCGALKSGTMPEVKQ